MLHFSYPSTTFLQARVVSVGYSMFFLKTTTPLENLWLLTLYTYTLEVFAKYI